MLPCFGFHTPDLIPFQDEGFHQELLYIQVFRILAGLLHGELVQFLVRLRPQRLYRGPLSRVEHPKLDAGLVRVDSHLPAKGVDFPHEMSLRRPSHRGVAGHHGDIVHGKSRHQRPASHASRCQSRFHTRVSRADDKDIIFSRNKHILPTFRYKTG